AAGQAPGSAAGLPQRGEEGVGVVGVEGDVDRACLVVLVEDLLPALAAVARAEDAAFGVGAVSMAERGHEDHVGVARIHNEAADVARVAESDVLPGLSTVLRLVHAIAVADVAANAGLPGANVDDVAVR